MDQHMTAIVELRERVRAHDEDIARHDQHLAKLDETVSELRAAIATVATKDDIMKLSRNIDDKFSAQLRDAHNSIPAKIGLWLTGGSVLVAVIAMFMRHG
jgi:phage shock protein A